MKSGHVHPCRLINARRARDFNMLLLFATGLLLPLSNALAVLARYFSSL